MFKSSKKILKPNIAILSSCPEDWGGSEELWGKSVPFLLAKGYGITVYKSWINVNHPEFIKLANQGVTFKIFDTRKSFLVRNFIKVAYKIKGGNYHTTFTNNPWVNNLLALLKIDKPDFAIISQGINFDGLGYAYAFGTLNIPYVLIAQKAIDFYWPFHSHRPIMLKVIQEAKACYFVSNHNLRLTEEQFGHRLTNGHVIFNPLKIGKILPYPNTEKEIRLACVGRLFILDKGQDILVRILSSKKWRERPVTITFVGSGVDEAALKDMAALLNVKTILFAGQVSDMEALWQQYHALVLPSRSEGLPLSMVEAMAAGRIVIISKAGGNTELIEENVTGFSGYPNEDDFDEAMERAWNQRDNWEAMGKEAAEQIAAAVPASPENFFVEHLLQYIATKNC